MYKSLIFKFVALLLSFSAWGQYSEIGFFGGGTNFVGDVGDYGLHLPKDYSYGGFYRYNFNRHWSVRAQVNFGRVRNADSLSSYENRLDRNLSFQSKILEGSIMMEFNFLEYENGKRNSHTPFIMGGFGAFRFDPETEYQGQMYALRELGTEGQNTSENNNGFYANGSTFFIFGLGYKWSVAKFMAIGIESTFRSTNTDYLDDVSGLYADPVVIEEARGSVAAALSDRSLSNSDKREHYRGNPQTNDWYVFTGVTLQFKFGELYEKCASFVGQ